jgi:lysophospholipase L1-like esterase
MNAAARSFEDGDTVVFFGDSLTHGGLYLKYVTDFYRTRYPGRRIRFVNSGIGGDTAGGAMKRIPEDIAEYDPTWVVFHFGMNDVGRGAYNDESSPETLKSRAGAYADYCRNLDALVGKVAEAATRAKFIYMTPTIYDDTAIPEIPPDATGGLIQSSAFSTMWMGKLQDAFSCRLRAHLVELMPCNSAPPDSRISSRRPARYRRRTAFSS